jgi:hypothetical protein
VNGIGEIILHVVGKNLLNLYVVENRTSKIILDVAEKRTGVVVNTTG